MKKYTLLFIILILSVLAFSIGCAPEDPSDPIVYPKVKLDKTEVILDVGETKTITAQVLEQGAQVTWESSNQAICSVDNGVIVGITSGEAVISASASGETAYCVVEVRAPQETSGAGYDITLNKYNLTLKTGEKFTLTAGVVDNGLNAVENPAITYTSSNEQVATVSVNGEVTAVSQGTAFVTVKYVNGDAWVSRKVNVTVTENYSVEIEPFSQTMYIDDLFDLNYIITKDGTVCEYDQTKILVYISDNTVASIENGKVKGLTAGYVTLTVLLTDVNVKGTYSFAVIDPNADPINLAIDPEIKVFLDASVDLRVKGVSWGTLIYEIEDKRFIVEDGVLYAPNVEATTTLTIKHLETKQTVTTTIKAVEFNPCITTAEEFLMLGSVKSGEAYLGADIDLSDADWKLMEGYTGYSTLNVDLAYLVDYLRITLDGRGHKVTVRYDHEYGENVQVAGLFINVTATGMVKNLQLDFEAKYVGNSGTNGTPTAGYKVCALTYVNRGSIVDNFINATFYSDKNVTSQRACGIGYYGSVIDRNIYNSTIYEAEVLQTGSNLGWERSNGSLANNVIVGNLGENTQNKYNDRDSFFTAWANQEILNQDTYTNWSVSENKLYLCDKLVDDNFRVVEYFNPCITTAEQLLAISDAPESVYLGADIDLSTATWSKSDNFTHGSMTLSVAYLIEKLDVNLDGRGHKITVRYDNEFTDTVQIGGLFAQIHSTATIKNLHLDFKANYTGVGGTDGTGTQAFKACALAMRSYALIEDCFINAEFRATQSSGSQRTCAIGYYGSRIERSIYKSATYKNNVLQSPGYFGWERAGGNITNTIQIDNHSAESQNKYKTMDSFFTAWANNEILNQTDYTNWTIDTTNKTIKLNNVQITW